jgi:hypothetical protein
MQTDIIDELLCSKSFLKWSPQSKPPKQQTLHAGRGQTFLYRGRNYTNLVVDEKHYTPAELAKAWGLSAETIRQIFRMEPGVLRIGNASNKETRGSRDYLTLRIPQSVAVRVHARLSATPQTTR